MKQSISKRILKTVLYRLIVVILLFTAVSILVVTKVTDDDSEALLSQALEKETVQYDSEFTLLENSVATISSYVHDLEKQCSSEDELLSDSFCDRIEDLTLSIANRTDGAMAVYFRYDPELTGSGTSGFFWSRNSDSESFAYVTPTDILQYDRDDTEHVGWFYEPKERQEALWMSPYYNENIDVFMISYVIPYYTESGDFLGVIGMDIDFSEIIKLTDELVLYDSGKVELIDLSSYLVYSSDGKGTVRQEDLSTTLYDHITTIDDEEKILDMTDENGEEFLTCIGRLQNGMRLMLMVPEREVNANRNGMLIIFAIIVLIAMIFTTVRIIQMTHILVHPLKILTRITGKYAKNDWSETYISDTEDEIQELSESISIMAETTKSYIEMINRQANTDELTGLKNKNCYLSYIERFSDGSIGTDDRYAVAVFDINFLKKTNDTYGHEHGDMLIKMAGMYICDIFSHSPVFRIGGDEYVAILENSDYRNRDFLGERFVNEIADQPPVAHDIPLSISFGIACFPEDGSSYDEVFECADERMYTYKKVMKVGRE